MAKECASLGTGKTSAGTGRADNSLTMLVKEGYVVKNGAAPYQPDIPATSIFENQGIDTVQIAAPDGRPYVTMDCAGFPQLAIWANAKGPYVCLEPWYGRTDDAGFAGTLAQKPGVQILDSGETQEISYEIEFHSECD